MTEETPVEAPASTEVPADAMQAKLEATLAEITAITAQAAAVKGTQSEVTKAAMAEVLWMPLSKEVAKELVDFRKEVVSLTSFMALAIWLQNLVTWAEVIATAERDKLLASRSGAADGADFEALKALRAEKADFVQALVKHFGAKMPLDDDGNPVKIPGLRAPNTSGTKSTKSVTTSRIVFSRKDAEGNVNVWQNGDRDFSRFAYYEVAKMVPHFVKGKDKPASTLEAFLKEAGFNNPKSEPWEVEVAGWTFSMSLKPSEPDTDGEEE